MVQMIMAAISYRNDIAILSHDITALSFSLVIFIMDHGLETCIFRNQGWIFSKKNNLVHAEIARFAFIFTLFGMKTVPFCCSKPFISLSKKLPLMVTVYTVHFCLSHVIYKFCLNLLF